MEYFVTGIGTDVGKTVASAILCNALEADYWKPVQAGALDNSDSHFVRSMIPSHLTVHPEAYRLTEPMSPHAAARIDGIEIETGSLKFPSHERTLIIEGAGGLHVPLNDRQTYIDLLPVWNVPTILVSRNYLGSINHTLMSYELLSQRGIPIAGIVLNGPENDETERIIERYTGATILGRIPEVEHVNEAFIRNFASVWKFDLAKKLAKTFPVNEAIERKVRLMV